jgi:hypothetical protein
MMGGIEPTLREFPVKSLAGQAYDMKYDIIGVIISDLT